MSATDLIHHYHDVLIAGAGGAGLRAAVAASENGASVACLSKVPPTRSHTVAAQGGINAALGNRQPDDWLWHMYDTIRGSDWLGDQDAIALMCERAPDAILELEHMGMPFTRDDQGLIYQRAYGGQKTDYGRGTTAYRACAVADRTGHALLHTLYGQALRQQVEFFVEYTALDLLMDEQDHCRGLLAWHMETGGLHVFHAHATILATGGFGQVYASTTSSTICTGDGNAMCLRAGLPLQDMEFIQFHPTGLYGSGILVTEGARGEGAILKNAQGERFMERYAPASMELASRDVISRAMMQEILAGRGCGKRADHLHLCLDHLPEDVIRSKLPAISDITQTFTRLDIRKDPIPVLPTVHYTMGGIPTNLYSQAITIDGKGQERIIPGLMAIGEASCTSVHGANRLGCNGLLELVVFGKAAGQRAATNPPSDHKKLTDAVMEPVLTRFDALRHKKGDTRPSQLRKELQQLMQSNVSIFRNDSLLEAAEKQLHMLWAALEQDMRIADTSLLWNNDLLDALEVDNLLRQAAVTIASARGRRESRGAHWRDDVPMRNDEAWLKHSMAFVDDTGQVRLQYRPVRMHAQAPESEQALSFPPEERAY